MASSSRTLAWHAPPGLVGPGVGWHPLEVARGQADDVAALAAGKVIWITPTGAQGNRTAGIGVQFTDSAEGETVKGRIETLLAGTLNADKPTNTM